MAEDNWIPTCELRWNRRLDAKPLTFWEATAFGGGKGPRPVGYRLEQRWITTTLPLDGSHAPKEEWRPIPFADGCYPAEPDLNTDDRQFWPVGPSK